MASDAETERIKVWAVKLKPMGGIFDPETRARRYADARFNEDDERESQFGICMNKQMITHFPRTVIGDTLRDSANSPSMGNCFIG